MLESDRREVRSTRGIEGVYELFGQNDAGEYLHIAYHRTGDRTVVFHMRAMTAREKKLFRKLR